MKVKKGKLNYDQSGRAYPDNPRLDENWDCIWEYKDKYYRLIGDNEHKEWDEVNIYNQVIDEAYSNYRKTILNEFFENTKELRKWAAVEGPGGYNRKEFINKCKTDPEFSETWGLKIEERELSLGERVTHYETTLGRLHFIPPTTDILDKENIPTKLITITYKNITIESYE